MVQTTTRMLVAKNPDSLTWSRKLQQTLYDYNHVVHSTIDIEPAVAFFVGLFETEFELKGEERLLRGDVRELLCGKPDEPVFTHVPRWGIGVARDVFKNALRRFTDYKSMRHQVFQGSHVH